MYMCLTRGGVGGEGVSGYEDWLGFYQSCWSIRRGCLWIAVVYVGSG